jgi:hypothetical protein
MEVVFHFSKIFKINLDSTSVDLPMLKSKFHSFPAITTNRGMGVGGWGKLKSKLTQPKIELEVWAEHGKSPMWGNLCRKKTRAKKTNVKEEERGSNRKREEKRGQ